MRNIRQKEHPMLALIFELFFFLANLSSNLGQSLMRSTFNSLIHAISSGSVNKLQQFLMDSSCSEVSRSRSTGISVSYRSHSIPKCFRYGRLGDSINNVIVGISSSLIRATPGGRHLMLLQCWMRRDWSEGSATLMLPGISFSSWSCDISRDFRGKSLSSSVVLR